MPPNLKVIIMFWKCLWRSKDVNVCPTFSEISSPVIFKRKLPLFVTTNFENEDLLYILQKCRRYLWLNEDVIIVCCKWEVLSLSGGKRWGARLFVDSASLTLPLSLSILFSLAARTIASVLNSRGRLCHLQWTMMRFENGWDQCWLWD